MYDSILRHISKFIQLDKREEAFFLSLLQHRKLRKRQYFLQEGDVCRYEAFILKGCLRTYEVDENGNEHVLSFGVENWWVGDLYSFIADVPSSYNIDALENSELLYLDRPTQELLYEEVPKFERYFRLLIQNAFVATQRRVISTISKPAEERYLEFLEKYPALDLRIPQHQIASYLGITPESLSRIRKQIQQKKG
jgi:CRP-like cAMP-binding protein